MSSRPGYRGIVLAACALLANASIPSSARASPLDLFGAGTRSRAVGGTGVTRAGRVDATSPHEALLNPSRLSAAARPVIAVGYGAVRFLADAGVPMPEAHAATGNAAFGLLVPLRLGPPLQDRLALGVSASIPGSVLSRVRILNPERPQFPLLSVRSKTLNVGLGLGAALPFGIRLGAGLMTLASLRGSIQLDAGASGTVSSIRDDKLTLMPAAMLGAEWSPLDDWALGAVWKDALQSEFELKVNVRDLADVVVPPLNITGLAQYDPAQLQVELAHRTGDLHLAAGISWKQWSKLERFKAATVVCPKDQPECLAPDAPTIDAKNTLVPRLGAEYTLRSGPALALAFRAGYFYEPSPLQAQTGETNWLDNNRHALTLGYGVISTGGIPLTAAIAYQHHWLTPRDHQKPNGERITSKGSIDGVALDVEVGF
jgi:hypothetical protein